MIERLTKHRDIKYDQFNRAGRQFHDTVLLTEKDCLELVEAINAKLLVESGNETAKHLRNLLCLSIDIQRTEDALAKLSGCTCSDCRS